MTRLQWLVAIGLTGWLAACSKPGWQGTPIDVSPIATKTQNPTGQATTSPTEIDPHAAQKPVVRLGRGAVVGTPSAARAEENGDISLNFVNASVHDVVDSVLGQMLGLNYTIDPKLQATITMQTAKPLRRDDVLPMLEAVLQANGVALVKADGVYRVTALSGAAKGGGLSVSLRGAGQPGYGLQIIPLKYASAVQLQKVLEPFVPTGAVLQVDDARNLLLVSGTQGDVDSFLRMVDVFDVDWMNGMSFGLFPLHQGSAASVARELTTIFSSASGGPSNGVLRVIPIERINSILLVSAQPRYIQQAQDWIDRLDSGVDESAARLYVYYVQNSRATDLARVLGQMYGGASIQNLQPQGAPGSDMSTLGGGAPYGSPFGGGAGGLGGGLGIGSEIGGGLGGGLGGAGGIGGAGIGGMGAAPSPIVGGAGPAGGGQPGTPQAPAGAQGTLGASGETTGELPPPVGLEDRAGLLGGGAAGGSAQATRIVADEKNNALIIRARPSEYRKIEGVLKKLDILPQQVLIEATIAEVTLNDSLNYGLQWFFKEHGMHSTLSTVSTGALASTFPGFSAVFGSSSAQAVLNALSNITNVNIVSAPHLVVLDHQTAILQVGDEVPVPLAQAVSTIAAGAPLVNSITYLNTGVIMRVTPRVNANGVATLEIEQEVSAPVTTTSSQLNAPTISQRRLRTVVSVPNGGTLALGGLIQETKNNGRSGVPIISDIPILGALASNTTQSIVRTELLVLLTPTVVHNSEEARDVTDELEQRMHSLLPIRPRKL